jgi:hypothetical protein
MSIVLVGSTSGSCTLQEQAVAGTSVLTLPVGTGTIVANNVNSAIVSGTAVASTSGTSIDFTSIPSWVKRITVMFNGVSTSGTSLKQIQIGDSGGIETTGYLGTSVQLTDGSSVNAALITTGYGIRSAIAADVLNGSIIISNVTGNVWAVQGTLTDSSRAAGYLVAGAKTLSDILDRVRITTVNGTDTFDAGSLNILYE